MKEKQHFKWVDIVKGFAIIAVVVWHTKYQYTDFEFFGFTWGGVRSLFGTLWHVPVFLIVGGFFLRDEEVLKPISFIKKRWKTLYLKLLLYYLIFIILHNFFFEIGFMDEHTLYSGKYIHPINSLWGWITQFGWALLAAREPFLGAMWFVNMLFLGLCYYSIVSYLIYKYCHKERNVWCRAVVLFLIAFISFYLTHIFHIHITRLTPSLVAPILIYIGYITNRKLHFTFQNKYVFFLCLLTLIDISLVWGKDVTLPSDSYYDMVLLVIGSVCSLYCLCFISKKIEHSIVGKYVALCGKESFHIMALHLLGFKVATFLLLICGIKKPLAELHSPANNIFELMIYVSCSILFSLGISKIIHLIHNKYASK